MFFVLFITVLFIGISIYFYFRAEGLQRTLLNTKREFSSTQKENKSYVDSMALIAKRHEDFAKHRLEKIKTNQSETTETLEAITPLINNYTVIFRECLKGKGKLQPITKKCYESYDKEGFKRLVAYISKQEAHIKRMWSSNNLSGYISLIEALLLLAEQAKEN
jgi:hypothetical protein